MPPLFLQTFASAERWCGIHSDPQLDTWHAERADVNSRTVTNCMVGRAAWRHCWEGIIQGCCQALAGYQNIPELSCRKPGCLATHCTVCNLLLFYTVGLVVQFTFFFFFTIEWHCVGEIWDMYNFPSKETEYWWWWFTCNMCMLFIIYLLNFISFFLNFSSPCSSFCIWERHQQWQIEREVWLPMRDQKSRRTQVWPGD